MNELVVMFLAFQRLMFYQNEERVWKKMFRMELRLVFFLMFTILVVLGAMEHVMNEGHNVLFMVDAGCLVINCVNMCGVIDRLTDNNHKVKYCREMWTEVEAEIYAMLPR